MESDATSPIPEVLLSYDVPGEARSLAVRVCRIVFGRADASPAAPTPFVQRPGVVWIGQSVLLLPRPTAEELASDLRRLGVNVSTAVVRVEPGQLDRFRRGRPG